MKMDQSKLDGSKLIVNYLPHSMNEDGLRACFESIGAVESVKLMRNKAGESLAYGFVNFKSPQDGQRAIATLNGVEREGKTMKVSVAKPKHLRETTNLYVADLPEHASETAVRELFEQYGEVNNCKLVMNQDTGHSRGVAFVLFHQAHEAEAAILGLNGSVFPGSNKTITVKIKDEPKSQNPDLYVANVPKAMSEETLKIYFEAYGQVRTCKIVRDVNTGASKGVAFVHFSKRKESEDAIAGLHDTRLPGSTQNLVVKVKEQKPDNNAAVGSESHSLIGYPPPPPVGHDWSGYGYAHPPIGTDTGYTREEMVTSPNGEVKRVIHHYVSVPPAEMAAVKSGERENGGGPMRRGTYGNNRYDPRGVGARADQPPPTSIPPLHSAYHPYSPTPGRFSLEDAKAQPAHQLFIYNLGPDADEAALYDLFAPFGAVTKVFPMRDAETKLCKGFGFVEMPSYDAAVLAIAALNGMPFKLNNMKPLKVDFKTQKNK